MLQENVLVAVLLRLTVYVPREVGEVVAGSRERYLPDTESRVRNGGRAVRCVGKLRVRLPLVRSPLYLGIRKFRTVYYRRDLFERLRLFRRLERRGVVLVDLHGPADS